MRLPAVAAGLLVLLIGFACNLTTENGHTYLNVKKDTAWVKFDRVLITWTDSATRAGGTLYDGDPKALQALNKFLADGYQGGKITITVKGFNGTQTVYEERRSYDGANPAATTKQVIPNIDPPVVVTPKPTPPRLSPILAEPTVSIHDSVSFIADAILDSGSLKGYAWDYDGDGKFEDSLPVSGLTARLKGGFRYRTKGIFKVTLKALSATDSSATAQVTVSVLQDEPIADAGSDTTVYPNSVIRLHGRGKDGLGWIVKTEWKIGTGTFMAAPGDTTFTAPATLQDLFAVFRVTDDDTQSVIDTVIIHVVSATESNLTGIVFSEGTLSPQFNPATFTYVDTVPFTTTSLTVTPTGNGVLTVNTATVVSGQPSASIAVNPGSTPVKVSVKLAGAPEKVYTIIVVRPSPSANTALKSITIRAGGLDTTFVAQDSLYNFTVVNALDSVTVTANPEDTTSTLTLKGLKLDAPGFSRKLPLLVGSNSIPLVVTAQNGTSKTFTLVINRASVDTATSKLTGLTVSKGALAPTFSPAVTAYFDTVAADVAFFTLTPTGNGNITVDGVAVVSGQPSQTIVLNPGNTLVTVKVKYGGTAEKTTTISVYRSPLSSNADLTGLALTPGALDKTFSSGDTVYTAAVNTTVTSIAITATPADTAARTTITPASPVSLNVGTNLVSVVVTAKNGTRKTYAITITRANPPSANANLATLTVTPGALDTAFKASDIQYKVSVANTVASSNIAATVADTTATLTITPSSFLYLKVGENPVTVVVTAQDGSKKTYTVTITRAASANANLSALTVSTGALVPPFNSTDTAYTVSVSSSVVSATVAATVADTTARLAISPPSPVSLNAGTNTVSVVVTAQNGSKKTYQVQIRRRLKVIAIAGGSFHTLVLMEDSTVAGWGWDVNGKTTPPAGLKSVKAIAAGSQHSIALKSDGTLVAWGSNEFGECDIPAGLTGVKAIAAQGYHTLALRQNGTVVAWGGFNQYGENTIPAGLTSVKAIATSTHSVALKEDGTVQAWGSNEFGECDIPAGLTGVKAIAASENTVVLKENGTLVAWGRNDFGQSTIPSGLSNVKAIAISLHTMVLKEDGTLVIWGFNEGGQCNIPPGLTGVSAIATGAFFSIALKADGTVATWGDDQNAVPAEFR